MRDISCAHILAAASSAAVRNHAIHLDGERIASVEPATNAEPLFALPALANARDHARATRSSSFGTAGKPLEIWLHWLALLPAVDPYLATAVSLARSARGGSGSVMVHYTRAQGLTDYVTEAKEVALAARDVGVRDGNLPGIDHAAMNEDLLTRFRHGIAQNATLAAALPHLERAVRDHFETPCC